MKRYLLILNLKAGNARPIESELTQLFGNNDIHLDVKKTSKPLDAQKFAKQAIGHYSVVIAAGGDGTINEVVNGLANSSTRLGIMPLGTIWARPMAVIS
jgi:diacylglycerol kinase family enzyme